MFSELQASLFGDRAVRIRQTLAGVYSRTSKGVHSDVDAHDARYVFLTTCSSAKS
jgi:hypothetical protein